MCSTSTGAFSDSKPGTRRFMLALASPRRCLLTSTSEPFGVSASTLFRIGKPIIDQTNNELGFDMDFDQVNDVIDYSHSGIRWGSLAADAKQSLKQTRICVLYSCVRQRACEHSVEVTICASSFC
jgi:hypothetical protein